MIIKYKFADGTTSAVEVDDELGAFITASRREENNYDRKARYHCVSLDAFTFEGEAFADERDNPSRRYEFSEGQSKVDEFLRLLTDVQRRRVEALLDGKSKADIAREERTSYKTVADCIELVRKKAAAFFHD